MLHSVAQRGQVAKPGTAESQGANPRVRCATLVFAIQRRWRNSLAELFSLFGERLFFHRDLDTLEAVRGAESSSLAESCTPYASFIFAPHFEINMAELPETRISLLCKIAQNPDDSQGWTELVAFYQPPIYRTLRCRRLQHADAMEVTQQVLVALVRYLPQFENDGKPASFRRWLNRIISNLCWKAWAARQNPVAAAGNPQAHDGREFGEVADQQQQEELRHDLEIQHYRHRFRLAAEHVRPRFEPVTWQAFWLSSVEGRAPAEVARTLGLTPGAVYIARSRVIARLRYEVEQMEARENL